MAANKNLKESRGRKWSEVELKVFASVLADDRNEFALTLETLALKSQPMFIFLKLLRKSSMLAYRRRTYLVHVHASIRLCFLVSKQNCHKDLKPVSYILG